MNEEEAIINQNILLALRNDDFETANRLIDDYHIATGLDTEYDEGPLHVATRSNAVDIIRKLVKDGADVNLEMSYPETPLISAIMCGATDAIVTLLELGANLNGRPRTEDGGPTTPLMEAARRGNYHILQMLLEAGANIEDRDYDWDRAIDYVESEHDEKAIEILKKWEEDHPVDHSARS